MQERAESILLSLKKLGYISRSQIQIIHELGSPRTAQRTMKSLEEYVSSFRDGETIFYLNQEGRNRVGASKVLKKSTTARHYIMRNDLYIAYECPDSWKNELRLRYKPANINVVTDAFFERDGHMYIVEVDHTQKMKANENKISKYKKLLDHGVLKSPKFVWITTTEYRREQLGKMCDGLDVQIFTVADFH